MSQYISPFICDTGCENDWTHHQAIKLVCSDGLLVSDTDHETDTSRPIGDPLSGGVKLKAAWKIFVLKTNDAISRDLELLLTILFCIEWINLAGSWLNAADDKLLSQMGIVRVT